MGGAYQREEQELRAHPVLEPVGEAGARSFESTCQRHLHIVADALWQDCGSLGLTK